jgi:hypothetical protein
MSQVLYFSFFCGVFEEELVVIYCWFLRDLEEGWWGHGTV